MAGVGYRSFVEVKVGVDVLCVVQIFDGFEEIVAFEFLNGCFRIARDVEWVSLFDFESREKGLQVGNDQLLQPDEALGSIAAVLGGNGRSTVVSD